MSKVEVQSRLNINDNGIECDIVSIGMFDQGSRLWAAFRWKNSIVNTFNQLRWKNIKKAYRNAKYQAQQEYEEQQNTKTGKVKNDNQVDENSDLVDKHLMFSRPFDYYLFDTKTNVVYAAGTVVGHVQKQNEL